MAGSFAIRQSKTILGPIWGARLGILARFVMRLRYASALIPLIVRGKATATDSNY
jgi:hypothetical protein